MTAVAPGAHAALVRRLYDATSRGALDELDEVLAPNVLDHGVGGERPARLPEIKQTVADFRAAFPDTTVTVEDLVEAGDRVAVRWTVRATHRGEFQGIPATGKTVTMTGTDFVRVAGGRVVERWGNSDELGLLQQLVDRRTSAEETTERRQRIRRATARGAEDRRSGSDRRAAG